MVRFVSVSMVILGCAGCLGWSAATQDSGDSEAPARLLEVAASNKLDDGFRCQGGMVTDGATILSGGTATSMTTHAVPLEVETSLQTDGSEIRMTCAGATITLNAAAHPGELRIDGGPMTGRHASAAWTLPKDRLAVIREVVTNDGMAVYIDRVLAGYWFGDFRGIDAAIRFESPGVLTIERVRILSLPADCSIYDRLDPMTRLARATMRGPHTGGIHAMGEHDPTQGDSIEVAAPFDVKRNWQLDLLMIPGDIDRLDQMVFIWGDTQPGQDTIWVRQRGRSIEAGTWAKPDAYATAMLPEGRMKEWIPIALRFDAATQRLFLSIDGQIAAESPCRFIYFDRVMPACIGQAFHGDQLFTGRVRDVVLENR